ncbi:MAG: Kef-type K+ transport system membrane component KefB [Arenicella sp.]|jgi:Kef-type K+ transport system membrane component KefB
MHDIEILAIIWSSVFLASILADKTRLTPVVWYLFFGALLTNISILPVEMPIFIVDLADLGIIVIMFSLGFEEDTGNFLKSIKRSWGIAFFGALAPFSIAYALTLWFWKDPNIALLCGLAMMATAVSLTMVSLKSEGLNKTPAATGIMTSAVLDDIASLALVAALVPIATGESTLSADGLLLIVGKVVTFFLIVTLIGGGLFPASKGFAGKIPILRSFSLKQVLSLGKGEYTVLALLLIAVLVGLLAHYFGFHPAVGAYMAGLIIRQEYFSSDNSSETVSSDSSSSNTTSNNNYEQARLMIDNVAFSWLGPVFFVTLGSKLIFDSGQFISALPQALLLFFGLFVGQILSAGLAARYTGNFDWPESWMIGFGMLGRAELAFVVMEIAYVQYKVLSTDAFYTLMITCFLLNISVPLTIRWWKSHFQSKEA